MQWGACAGSIDSIGDVVKHSPETLRKGEAGDLQQTAAHSIVSELL